MDKATLDSLEARGAAKVLLEMAQGEHGSVADSKKRQDVEIWLRSKQVEAEALASTRRDAREEETLSIAKEANRIASDALSEARSNSAAARAQARSAKIAAIIATTAAIVASKEEIWSIISWFL